MAEVPEGASNRTQIIPSFDKEAQLARHESQHREAQLMLLTQSPEFTELVSIDDIHQHYSDADLEISETMTTLLGSSDGKVGNVGGLMATAQQADFMHIRRRAKSLRRASFPRRMVHAAARRGKYHDEQTGYVAQRIKGRIVARLKQSAE